MIIIPCEQNTPEWHAARRGRVTASNMEKIISPTGKESTQADKYMNQLIAEIITGETSETFKGNVHTERGHLLENEAAMYYSMQRQVDLQKVGFCTTDDGLVGCSPDRLVGEDGMLEIKVPAQHNIIELYLNDKLEQEHRPQTQAGLYVTKRAWIDTMVYHPLMKPIIMRSERNETYLSDMHNFLGNFHKKMQDRMTMLRKKGYMENAA